MEMEQYKPTCIAMIDGTKVHFIEMETLKLVDVFGPNLEQLSFVEINLF